jgi:glycosyltransferase involved in cell wall biosynthesis
VVTAPAREPDVNVTGGVTDIRPYLERASIFVVPLRIGGGTRLKLYEAMAMEIPVVSTSIGAEGLPVRDGEHLVIADGAERLADEVVRLLQDPSRQGSLARTAAAFVRRECSWERVAADFADICESVAGHRRSTLETQTP